MTIRNTLTILAATLAGAAAGAGTTVAQLPVPTSDPEVVHAMRSLPPECLWTHERDGQVALTCNPPSGGGWVGRGLVDIEGGRYVERDGTVVRKRLNLNIGAGNHRHRGYVVLSPDIGRGTIMEDGHLRKLLLVRGARYGGTEARIRVRFEEGLTACRRNRGCVDVYGELERLRRRLEPVK